MHGKKHPAKHSHSQSWGSWSEWKWDQIERRFYSERIDRHGNVECMWDGGAPTATNDDERTPRTEASIDQVTAGLGSLAVTSLGHSYSHSGKGKGILNTGSHDVHYEAEPSRLGSVPGTKKSYSQHGYPHHSFHRREGHTSFLADTSGDTSIPYHSQDNSAYEVEQALKISRDEILGNSRAGGPSTSGAHYDSGSIRPGTYGLDPTSFGDSETTPRGTPAPTHSGFMDTSRPDFVDTSRPDFVDRPIIRGTPGSVEQVDNRFVVENSFKFQPGEVFKILWSEPTGQVAGDGASISDIRTMNDSAGQFYVGYRRFIIVTTDESHHSTCVPILTYDRRGCGKKGVRPNKHGIIYAVGQKPRLLKNEPELGFDPVPLEIYAEGETLARESRVNYSKLVTIEHNVKVFFIGRIPYPYFDSVSYAVDECWRGKMHKSNKKSRR
ncbi:hypothetical protein F4802DRAFT_24503 [Xylaria palmicola]|nr:hypothetical protein F4802DRAFT_24503 [Xylaria palmicola]